MIVRYLLWVCQERFERAGRLSPGRSKRSKVYKRSFRRILGGGFSGAVFLPPKSPPRLRGLFGAQVGKFTQANARPTGREVERLPAASQAREERREAVRRARRKAPSATERDRRRRGEERPANKPRRRHRRREGNGRGKATRKRPTRGRDARERNHTRTRKETEQRKTREATAATTKRRKRSEQTQAESQRPNTEEPPRSRRLGFSFSLPPLNSAGPPDARGASLPRSGVARASGGKKMKNLRRQGALC